MGFFPKAPVGYWVVYFMGGCQNYRPLLGTLNNRGRIIIVSTTTHIELLLGGSGDLVSTVLSTLTGAIASYKCSSFFYNPSY